MIELWDERVIRAAHHGEEYQLNDAYRKVALKQILVGTARDHFDLWQAEKLPFEELLRKVEEQSRANKLDTDVPRGMAGASVGTHQAQVDNAHQCVPCF